MPTLTWRPSLECSWLARTLCMVLAALSTSSRTADAAAARRHLFQATSANNTSAPIGAMANATAAQEALLAAWRTDIFSFWTQHGPDAQFGGFHGTLDRTGTPIDPSTKSLVQEARHLWAFSTLHEHGGLVTAAGVEAQPSAKEIADGQYAFLVEHMLDPSDGRFWFEVSRNGTNVTMPGKNLYANCFAIYALSKYARVFERPEPAQQALRCFKAWDDEAHDNVTGGYDESSSSPVLDSVPLSGARAVNQTEVPQLSRSFNTHFHAIEALAELMRASPQEPLVSTRLREMVDIFINRMVVNGSYVAPNYNLEWQPLPANISYGHNIEATWLVADAVDTLVGAAEISNSTAAEWTRVLVGIGNYIAAEGYDSQYGGVFESGPPGEPASLTTKGWWAQAEGLLGFRWLHQQTGEQIYLDMLAGTMQFIEAHLHDKQYGEWYWQSNRSGEELLPFNSGGIDFAPTTKGTAWKASYHTGRAVLFLQQQQQQ